MRKGIIYKATSPSGKVYIGQTIQVFKQRQNRHLNDAFYKNSKIYNSAFSRAIRKYGRDNIIWDILLKNIEYKQLYKLEVKTIAKYNSYNNGYNSTIGGEGSVGRKISEKTRAKMSKAKKGKVWLNIVNNIKN